MLIFGKTVDGAFSTCKKMKNRVVVKQSDSKTKKTPHSMLIPLLFCHFFLLEVFQRFSTQAGVSENGPVVGDSCHSEVGHHFFFQQGVRKKVVSQKVWSPVVLQQAKEQRQLELKFNA